MRVHVQSTRRSRPDDQFEREVAGLVEGNLSRFGGRVRNVEVLLIEEADDPRRRGCILEAQLHDADPIAVRAHARTLTRAVAVGTQKMEDVIDRTLQHRNGDDDLPG